MKTSVPGNARAHSKGNRVSTHIFVRHREGFVADALQSYLQDDGYHVTVTNGFDAVVKHSQPADTCLVDMGVSGANAGIRRVVTMEQPPRVVALVDNERHIALALDSGANACVTAADGLERLSHILRSEIVMTSRETAAVAQRGSRSSSQASLGLPPHRTRNRRSGRAGARREHQGARGAYERQAGNRPNPRAARSGQARRPQPLAGGRVRHRAPDQLYERGDARRGRRGRSQLNGRLPVPEIPVPEIPVGRDSRRVIRLRGRCSDATRR